VVIALLCDGGCQALVKDKPESRATSETTTETPLGAKRRRLRLRVFKVVCVSMALALCCPGKIVVHADAAVQAETAESKDDPSKGSKDVDQVVAYPIDRVLRAAKEALAVYGCDIKKEKPDSLECTRDRHIGVMVGSGGEKVTVQLSAKDSGTRVQVKTGKGFVGRLGKKNWSTPIFAEMTKTLAGS
jgi:hypothetical protein